MPKPRVFVTRRIPEAGLQAVQDFAEVEVWEDEGPIPHDVLCEKVSAIEGLYCLLTDVINEELLAGAPKLCAVSTMSVGYDHIDVDACTRRKIPVGNTPGVLTETTADFAFALLMAAARRIGEAADFAKAGRWGAWDPTLLVGHDVHGATLGIIGFGRIGQAVARRARGFGMRVLANHSRSIPDEILRQSCVEQMPFDRVVEEADFVSLHVPLTPRTEHLINRRVFHRMKPIATLINTARGRVVDPKALYEALRDRTIASAALDVTDPEPISPKDPLLTLPNCLVVPHIASASMATRTKMALIAAENLRTGLSGERLPYCVNPVVFEA